MDASDFDEDGGADPDWDGVIRSQPIDFGWRFADRKLIEGIGLPAARGKCATATERLAALLYKAHRQGREISFGRSKSAYVGKQITQGPDFTFEAVMRAVAALTAAGLAHENRARPGSRGWRSTITATPQLIGRIQDAAPEMVALIHGQADTIEVRDKDGRALPIGRGAVVEGFRRRVEAVNEMSRAMKLELGVGEMIDLGFYRCTTAAGRPVDADLRLKEYRRIFNGNFKCGGRHYLHGAQSLPKEIRKALLIDGEATFEYDIEAEHARMLYAKVGKPMPPKPFDLDGWDRPIVKRAFYILVNADSEHAACLAIAGKLPGGRYQSDQYQKARALIQVIKTAHPFVAGHFGSGYGRHLMRHDSDLAERFMLEAAEQGIFSVSIYDSFIFQDRLKGRGRELVDKALEQTLRELNPDAFPELQVINGAPPSLVLLIPHGAQPDMFQPQGYEMDRADLEKWRGGKMPPSIRAALKHERTRRGITQREMAEELGISRPQLANAEMGRFGLGEVPAGRVRTMLESAERGLGAVKVA